MALQNTTGDYTGGPVIGSPPRIPKPPGGDANIGSRLEIAATVTFVFAAIVVGLRFQARIKYARLGWDDYLMVFAAVCPSLLLK